MYAIISVCAAFSANASSSRWHSVAHTRTAVSMPPSGHSNMHAVSSIDTEAILPIAKATRYVDIGGVGANSRSTKPSSPSAAATGVPSVHSAMSATPSALATSSVLASATLPPRAESRRLNTALNCGSSKHGKPRLASVLSNCVTAR